jgi:hypothetical protein
MGSTGSEVGEAVIMSQPFYKLNKAIVFTDHEGKEKVLLQDQLFHWNQHRFVTADGPERLVPIEIARSKVYAAGAKMQPCDSSGKLLDLSIGGPDIVMPDPMMPERKVVMSV